jgi:hypothetical protein
LPQYLSVGSTAQDSTTLFNSLAPYIQLIDIQLVDEWGGVNGF